MIFNTIAEKILYYETLYIHNTKQKYINYQKEYHFRNREEIAEKRKSYLLENKERTQERIKRYILRKGVTRCETCDCDIKVVSLLQHLKTKKHQNNLKK